MSFQFRALSDLIADVEYRYSIGGVKKRHPPIRLKQLWNSSWSQLRTRVSLASDGTFLEATAPASLPIVAAITGEAYAEIDWPIGAARIYGIRAQRDATSRWYPLKPVSWSAFHDFQGHGALDAYRSQPGPVAYCARTIPKAVETVETAGKIMVMPVPRGGLYRLWYMEAWQPQLGETDLFAGHDEWFEFAIYSTMIKMLGPDADSKKVYPQWVAERANALELITATAQRLDDGMALEPRDARFDGDDFDGFGGPL